MVIGSGAARNYTALLLFVAGMVAAGVAVYCTQIRGRWSVPTAVSLLLMLVACGLVAARRDQ